METPRISEGSGSESDKEKDCAPKVITIHYCPTCKKTCSSGGCRCEQSSMAEGSEKEVKQGNQDGRSRKEASGGIVGYSNSVITVYYCSRCRLACPREGCSCEKTRQVVPQEASSGAMSREYRRDVPEGTRTRSISGGTVGETSRVIRIGYCTSCNKTCPPEGCPCGHEVVTQGTAMSGAKQKGSKTSPERPSVCGERLTMRRRPYPQVPTDTRSPFIHPESPHKETYRGRSSSQPAQGTLRQPSDYELPQTVSSTSSFLPPNVSCQAEAYGATSQFYMKYPTKAETILVPEDDSNRKSSDLLTEDEVPSFADNPEKLLFALDFCPHSFTQMCPLDLSELAKYLEDYTGAGVTENYSHEYSKATSDSSLQHESRLLSVTSNTEPLHHIVSPQKLVLVGRFKLKPHFLILERGWHCKRFASPNCDILTFHKAYTNETHLMNSKREKMMRTEDFHQLLIHKQPPQYYGQADNETVCSQPQYDSNVCSFVSGNHSVRNEKDVANKILKCGSQISVTTTTLPEPSKCFVYVTNVIIITFIIMPNDDL